MYGKKQLDLLNGARLEIFLKKYKSNTRGAVISCVKKIGHYQRALVSSKKKSNEQITSAVHGTMLQ